MSINLIDEIYQAIHKTKEKPPYTTSVKGQLVLVDDLYKDFIELSVKDYIKHKNPIHNQPIIVNWKGWHGTVD